MVKVSQSQCAGVCPRALNDIKTLSKAGKQTRKGRKRIVATDELHLQLPPVIPTFLRSRRRHFGCGTKIAPATSLSPWTESLLYIECCGSIIRPSTCHIHSSTRRVMVNTTTWLLTGYVHLSSRATTFVDPSPSTVVPTEESVLSSPSSCSPSQPTSSSRRAETPTARMSFMR